jgi:hypothetical protein
LARCNAVIDLPGSYAITSSVNQTVAGIQMGTPLAALVPKLRITGGIFTALNGTGGGSANGSIIVEGGATLNIGGNWSGSGRVNAEGGTVNIAGGQITGTNIFNAIGGDIKLTDETITQGTTAGGGGQIRTGGGVGGTVDIVDGTISFGQIVSRAQDGLGTMNLDGVKLVDVLIDTTNFGAGHNVIQTSATGTILDGDTSQPGNPNGVINTAHLMVQDGTDLTLEGTIDNRLFVDPSPASETPPLSLAIPASS